MSDRARSAVLGPTVAGRWYPADGDALGRELDDLYRRADAEAADGPAVDATALIAPHAALAYSGLVAARGFRLTRIADVERVLLLGPSHYYTFEDAVVPDVAAYRTPLGEVPLDREAIELLCRNDEVRWDRTPFEPEHSLEIEIPFLQRRLPAGWQLVPLLVSLFDGSRAERLAAALKPLIGPRTLVVISSDFTHYGPRFGYVPFTEDVPGGLERLDMGAIDSIVAGDAQGFEAYVGRTGATICGRHPIGILLRLLSPRPEAQLAAYDNSGRITGEWDHSVSYASVAFAATST